MENKIIYSKKNKKNQQMWNYMRRNKIFRAGDLLMVCEVNFTYMSKYLRFFEKAGYIKCISKKRNPLLDREYRFIKNTGLKAPLAVDNSLFDYNINESFDFSPDKPRKIEIPETLIKILSSINKVEITRKEVLEITHLSQSQLDKWWNRLVKMGVIGLIEINEKHPVRHYSKKYKKNEKGFVYKYNPSRAQEIKKAIEKDGVYTYINRDLKSLWIHNKPTNS